MVKQGLPFSYDGIRYFLVNKFQQEGSQNSYYVYVGLGEKSPSQPVYSIRIVVFYGYLYSWQMTVYPKKDLALGDGSYESMHVGSATKASEATAAGNLLPYDDLSGNVQEEPFLIEATGTDNGAEADAIASTFFQLREKRGNTIVYNQLCDTSVYNGVPIMTGMTFSSALDGEALKMSGSVSSITQSSGAKYFNLNNGPSAGVFRTGHKYLFYLKEISGTRTGGDNASFSVVVGSNDISPGDFVVDDTLTESSVVSVRVKSGTTFSDYTVALYCVDLTVWYVQNSLIPSDLISHPSHWFRYYQGSMKGYNPGQLKTANSRYIKTIGRNQWDEETRQGYYDDATGNYVNSPYYLACKNPINAIPGTSYHLTVPAGVAFQVMFYDADDNYISFADSATFTTPVNCAAMRFYLGSYGTTYNHDITLSFYYSGESGYDQYYPYEVLADVDTGSEDLISAGSARDAKKPSGVIERNVADIDMGDVDSYTYNSAYGFRFALPLRKRGADCGIASPVLKNRFTNWSTFTGSAGETGDYFVDDDTSTTYVFVKNLSYTSPSDFKSAMDGKHIYYELATPTTEQGTEFNEVLPCEDFGSIIWRSLSSNVPQAWLAFFPCDYLAFIDTLYKYTSSSAESLAKKGNLSAGDPDTIKALLDYVDGLHAIEQANAGGTLRHQLAQNESISFDNTDSYVITNSNTWIFDGTLGGVNRFSTSLSLSTSFTVPKAIMTKYKYNTSPYNSAGVDKCFCIVNGVLYISDNSYTDATAFKAAMRGVLLAYEKA